MIRKTSPQMIQSPRVAHHHSSDVRFLSVEHRASVSIRFGLTESKLDLTPAASLTWPYDSVLCLYH